MVRAMTIDTIKPKDPLAKVLLTKPESPSAGVSAMRPKNPPANVIPTEGYFLEIDGKIKVEYQTSEEASKAGLDLKTKFPKIQVNVFDAKQHSRTLVALAK